MTRVAKREYMSGYCLFYTAPTDPSGCKPPADRAKMLHPPMQITLSMGRRSKGSSAKVLKPNASTKVLELNGWLRVTATARCSFRLLEHTRLRRVAGNRTVRLPVIRPSDRERPRVRARRRAQHRPRSERVVPCPSGVASPRGRPYFGRQHRCSDGNGHFEQLPGHWALNEPSALSD
jgi:hypothetical protein